MSEEKKVLKKEENLDIWRPAWRGYWLHYLMMLLVCVTAGAVTMSFGFHTWVWWLAGIVMFAIFIHAFLNRIARALYVREDEIELREGWLKRRSVEISYQSIRTVQVDQTLVQLVLNIGDLSIASSGTGDFEINKVPNIYNPRELRNRIQDRERVAKGAVPAAPAPAAAPAAPQA